MGKCMIVLKATTFDNDIFRMHPYDPKLVAVDGRYLGDAHFAHMDHQIYLLMRLRPARLVRRPRVVIERPGRYRATLLWRC